MLSLGLGLGITKQPRTGFTPASLNPELFVDVSDTSTLFQDAAGTTPVTSAGDPVRLVLDKSGNGNHLTAPSDAARPVYQTDGTYHWLEFDGVDDYVEAATRFGFSANPAMLVTAGLRPSTYGEGVERIWHIGDNVNGSISGALGSGGLSWRHNNGFRSFPVVAEGSDYVVSHSRQSGDNYNQQLCFLDGVSQVEVSSLGGFPVDTAAKFVVASNGTDNILGMRLYSLVVMGGHADGQRVQLEKWSAQKAGVTL